MVSRNFSGNAKLGSKILRPLDRLLREILAEKGQFETDMFHNDLAPKWWGIFNKFSENFSMGFEESGFIQT